MRQDGDQRTMDRIPFLDLGAEHAPLGDELRAAAARVLASERFILGPEVVAFERELAAELGFAEAVGVSSGTDALTALLMAAGIGPGDEVVTTPYSFFASVESIVRVGARPRVRGHRAGDDEPRSRSRRWRGLGHGPRRCWWCISSAEPARISQLGAACATANIPLLEDAAQAIGAAGLKAAWARRPLVFSVEEPGRVRRRRRGGDERRPARGADPLAPKPRRLGQAVARAGGRQLSARRASGRAPAGQAAAPSALDGRAASARGPVSRALGRPADHAATGRRKAASGISS